MLQVLLSVGLGLAIILGLVLSVLAQLSYSQMMYLLAEDRSLGPLSAIRQSKEIMQGHRGRLFLMMLRFLLWGLLCVLTCGIGLIWLAPYVGTSLARFFDDLHPPTAAQVAAMAPQPVAPPPV